MIPDLSILKGHKSTVADCFHNLYVDYGYRSIESMEDAFLSLFSFHNETLNIWSHLIGFVCVVIAAIHLAIDLIQSNEDYNEVIALEIYMICASLCLLLSTLYHWFGCLSENCHENLLRLDLTGVALLVTGSFIPGVYYGFYCEPVSQKVHLIITCVVLAVGLYAPWLEMKIYSRPIRPFVLASLVAYGIIPFLHWKMVTPEIIREKLVMGFIWMFFWYGLGFIIFVVRIPEIFFPSSEIISQYFRSHTIWHICVLNAVYTWFHFLMKYRDVLNQHGCVYHHYDINQQNISSSCQKTPQLFCENPFDLNSQ